MGWVVFLVVAIIAFSLFGRRKPPPPQARRYEPGLDYGYEEEYDPFENWKRSLARVWSGRTPMEFSYHSNSSGRTRRKIELAEILKSPDGQIYLYGFCRLRNEKRYFKLDRIIGPIECEGTEFDAMELYRALTRSGD